MRVLSLHNFTKFRCFISINDKNYKQFTSMGSFWVKFSTPPSGETMDRIQKRFTSEMMARNTSLTMQNLVEIARRTSAWEDEMWCYSLCFFLKITLFGRRPLWCVYELLPQDIASVFVGWFRCRLQRFFAEEKSFPDNGTVFKIVARWRYDWCANARRNCQNLRKWVQSLCAPLRPFRSKLKEIFYHSPIPHAL